MLVSLNNVSKTYETKTGVTYRALKNVSLQLPEKGMVFLVGASGSGKSTLLNVIGGLDNVDNGTIIVAGNSLKNMSNVEVDRFRNSLIGFVFQEFNLIETLNVSRNIKLSLDMQKDGESGLNLTKEQSLERVNEVLAKMELTDKASVKVNMLSGGQRQRVAIARALVKNPGIILADEPTGALDSGTGIAVMELFKTIATERLVIIVSHDIKLAEEYGDRIIELKDGSVYRDIIRAELCEETAERNVKVVSNTLVRFGNSEEPTEEDVEKINAILEERARKTFVMFETDERKVKAMFPALREAVTERDDSAKKEDKQIKVLAPNTEKLNNDESEKLVAAEKNKQKFKQYAEKPNEMKHVSLKKSNLPISGALKLSLNNLNHKKIRLIFTILVAAIALTLFGLSSSLLRFDTNVAIAATLRSGDIERVELYAADSGYNTLIREAVYKKVTDANPQTVFAKKYNLGDSIIGTIPGYTAFPGFNGYVEINNVESLGFTVLEGSAQPKDGVVIGEFAARAIILMGAAPGATSLSNLVGKTIKCSNKDYIVDGIIAEAEAETVIKSVAGVSEIARFYPEFLRMYVPIGYVANSLKKVDTIGNLSAVLNMADKRISLDFTGIDEAKLSNYVVEKVGSGVMETNRDIVISRNLLNTASIENFKNAKVVVQSKMPIFVSEGLNVVGIVDSDIPQIFFKRTIIDNAIAEEFYASSLITKIHGDTQKFVNSIEDAPLAINEVFVNDYKNYQQIFSILAYFIIAFACGFCLLSVLLLFSFISNSIKMTKKQIGILRAMGARRSDTFKIYALEGILIGIFSILLSFLALSILAPLINVALSVDSSFFLSIINIDFIIFGTMALIGLLVSILGVILPIRKFVKITPIGAISNK